ncbi:hypothetical protein B0T24DRAFT_369412 [Lasiosphaeria ovina]|uniref:Uncharacterized protein n=1 Tax=Lasiosphaeria ovina TaxID=92902 RepID=A0AAE0N2C1_9PEZI|nr:hypothetical protein B0T24DRAFT_369412 [Lasiosphaeria ovina]
MRALDENELSHILRRILSIFVQVQTENEGPTTGKRRSHPGRLQANIRVSPAHDSTSATARVDNPLAARPPDCVKGLEGGVDVGSAFDVVVAQEAEDQRVFKGLSCAGALPRGCRVGGVHDCTVVPASRMSCMMNAPSPTQPYCRCTSKYCSPSVALALSNGTKTLQSQNPARDGPCSAAAAAAAASLSTKLRTKLKMPSAPMTASKRSTVPSSKRTWQSRPLPAPTTTHLRRETSPVSQLLQLKKIRREETFPTTRHRVATGIRCN